MVPPRAISSGQWLAAHDSAECAHRACNPPGPSELESGYVLG